MPLGTTFWAYLAPAERTNYLTNPSFERGSAGWGTIAAGTIGTTATFQAFGAWAGSMAVTLNGTSGCFSPSWTAGSGSDYTISAYIRGQSGVPYRVAVGDSSGLNFVGSTTFTGGGTWHRYNFSYTESVGAARTFVLTKNSSGNAGAIYLDGVQVEVGSLTTYFDGDQDGCMWLGQSHNSQSYRSSQVRSGGSVIALADLGLTVLEESGMGMPPLENSAQSFALTPGAEFQRSRAGARAFTISSHIIGTTWRDFHNAQRTIIDAFQIDKVDPQQPTRFWYIGGEGTVQIDAVLDGGLEGGNRSGFTELVGVRFVAYDPLWAATTNEGTALTPRVSIGSTNYIAKRDSLGRWGTLGPNGTTIQNARLIYDLAYLNGTVILCGSWGTLGGTVYPHIGLLYSSGQFGTLAGGTVGLDARTGAALRKLAVSPSGTLFGVGAISDIGGTATRALFQWTGAAFGTLIGGTVDNPNAGGSAANGMAHLGGTLFVGGLFASAGGTAYPNVAMHVNNAFGTLTGGTVDASCIAFTRGIDGRIYLGGAMNVAGGTAVNGVCVWNGSFGSLSTGNNGTLVNSLTTELNGKIVQGGIFSQAGNATAYSVAEWNGAGWMAMGGGLQSLNPVGGNGNVLRVMTDPLSGAVYAGGGFGSVGGVRALDSVAKWNGYCWTPLDIDVAASVSGSVWAMLATPANELYIAGTWSGTARAASVSQAINTGGADAWPVVRIRNTAASGTARLLQIGNALTGDYVYWNYIMQAGEEAILDFTPGNRAFTSTYLGNITGKIMPGSNLTSFRLLPGTNWISFFVDNDSVVTGIYWRPRFWAAGGTIV